MPHPNDDDSITPVAPPSPPAPPPNRNDRDFSIDFNDKSRPEHCKFAFSVDHLHKLNDARSLLALRAFGGLEGLAYGLRTDAKAGLGVDEDVLDGVVTPTAAIKAAKTCKPLVTQPSDSTSTGPGGLELVAEIFNPDSHAKAKGYSDRRSTYGKSRLPKPRERSLLQLAWLAFNDKLIFLLTASNIVSLALGIYEAVAPGAEGDSGAKLEWIEGVTIAVAILVIVFGQAINDKVRNKKFVKLNEKNQDRSIAVVRSGKTVVISVFDILVGDLVRLEAGDVVPADGILVDGFTVKCDESPLTGESELVEKAPAREAETRGDGDCFVHSGTRIEHGVGTYLVTAVGTNSIHGRIRMSLRNDVEETPLQHKLGHLAKQIIIIGFIVGSIFFTILLIRWLVRLRYFVGTPREKGESFLDIFMLSVTVVVIGVPEGLSLAVAVALAFATTRMLKGGNLVRLLRSCETMGNATTICSDKTGTLTQNIMTVVSGVVGAQYSFGDQAGSRPVDAISAEVKNLLRQCVTVNSTAFEKGGPGSADFVGSSTETALLRFGRDHLATGPLAEERENSPPVDLFPFKADRKCMATVIKDGAKYRMLVKGAPEVILPHCSHAISKPGDGLQIDILDNETRRGLSSVARGFSDQMLRPIAVAYRDFESWPPITVATKAPVEEDVSSQNNSVVDFHQVLRNLNLVGILALRDPLRPEVIESVRKCHEAGVFVRMVTGDAFETARAISTECGIYTAGGIALDGPTFRKLSSSQLDLVLPRLQVLARSSPEDKARLVRHLKKLGETVAVTGDGTNDAYALKAADVGFAMGISGTEVAKEASSIILMDDNFSSIVKALAWGRTVNDAAKKFIQVSSAGLSDAS
jgi:P-type Ca2+ transporter type 2C